MVKHGQKRPAHVRGQVIYRRFQCLAPECVETLVVSDAECQPGFDIACHRCGYRHIDGSREPLFYAELQYTNSGETIAEGEFAPAHAAYLQLAERVKHCVLCYALLPLDAFAVHKSLGSGRQSECRVCKDLYNDLKNASRLTEQYREAAESRRLLRELSGERDGWSAQALLEAFDGRCFNCERVLQPVPGKDDGFYLDHTLPVAYLWPLEEGPTVLCRVCNARKADCWPGGFYKSEAKLRSLSTRTGIAYSVLAGPAYFNPAALRQLHENADATIQRWVRYPDRLRALRERILAATGEDVFGGASANARRAIGIDGE